MRGEGGGCVCVKEGIQEQKGKQKACEKETAKGQKKTQKITLIDTTFSSFSFCFLVTSV